MPPSSSTIFLKPGEAEHDVALDGKAGHGPHGAHLRARAAEHHGRVDLALAAGRQRDPQVAGHAHDAAATFAVDADDLEHVGAGALERLALRASEPIASTQRGPPPRLGFATPSDGHQPPTTFHVGPTASVTSSPAVTTATGVPIHEPTSALAVTGPGDAVRVLRAAAAEGEDVRVRSPPAYTVETSAAKGAGAPLTRTPEDEGADVAPSDEADAPVGAPVPLGAPVEQPASAMATAAETAPARARTNRRVRAGRRVSAGIADGWRTSVGRCWEVTAPP